jgi:hypothetical protein
MTDEDVVKQALLREKMLAIGVPIGYRYLVLEYSGSGDSGGVDDYRLLKEDSVEVFEDDYDINTYTNQLNGIKVWDYFESIIDDQLNNLPDWWNNDGGGGEALLDLYTGKFFAKHYVRIVETEDSDHSNDLFDSLLKEFE